MDFTSIGLQVPTILLPKQGIDLTRWAVIACDQYTSQPEYWEQVKKNVGDRPSTLHMILPEAYLSSAPLEHRFRSIHKTMQEYCRQKTLVPQRPGFIMIDRKTPGAASRKGLVVALDLEQYDYRDGSRSLIRPTEGTILERLPPRIRIREQAPLELPHTMVLIDDPERTVIEPLFTGDLEMVYDFELMMQGGHLTGYMAADDHMVCGVAQRLARLAEPEQFGKKYDAAGSPVLLYAVGDGNHSLAAAKAFWEGLKEQAVSQQAVMGHPARYALVELVNLHDEGLSFEPIHRVVFNVNAPTMLEGMECFYRSQGSGFSYVPSDSREVFPGGYGTVRPGRTHTIRCVNAGTVGTITITQPAGNLETATLQAFLDSYLQDSPDARIDYIHGTDAVARFGSEPDNIGFYLPALPKHRLFPTIVREGVLPRKAFSLGEADEKRFYLECRKIAAGVKAEGHF